MRIDRLEPSRHMKGRYLLHLEDGSVVKITEEEVLRFSLYSGQELSPERLAEVKAAGSENNAKALAAKMVGARPLSKKELLKRLEEKDIPQRDAANAADWLEDIGAVNDEAYAASIARHYSRKGYGLRRIQEEFYRRGIPRELWQDAMTEAESPEEGIDRYLQSKLRGKTLDEKEKKRLCDGLLRRGYSWSQVREGLNRFGADLYEE